MKEDSHTTKKLKVLLIDPWGIKSTGEYTQGLIYGLSEHTDLTVATNYHYSGLARKGVDIHQIFFKKSEFYKEGKIRRIIRGWEYIKGYYNIFSICKFERFDVIHINWLLMYTLDIVFIRKLKKYCKKIVYTAHNVLPHVNGEASKKKLRYIYSQVDAIILHGEEIKKEFESYFPAYVKKIYIQKHGCNIKPKINYDIKNIPEYIIRKISEANRVFLYIGRIFKNKGVDRLLRIWNEIKTNDLLVIAGNINERYNELCQLEKSINSQENVLFLNYFVPEDTANFLLQKCDLLLLPYRHASMSGVVFTAADFEKAVFATKVGAISEYLDNADFLVANDDDMIKDALMKIIITETKESLKLRGKKHNQHIAKECDWRIICEGVIKNVYKKDA